MTTKNAHDLILRIAGAFVSHPDDLRLEHQSGDDGSVYWVLRGNPEDEGKLVGNHGAHVDALRMIVTEFGRAARVAYTFRLVTERQFVKRQEEPRVDTAEFDPTSAETLLTEILCQCEIGDFAIRTKNGEGHKTTLAYDFHVVVANPTDYSALTIQRKFKHREGETMAIEGALGTLFRAMGKVSGVRFRVVIDEPV